MIHTFGLNNFQLRKEKQRSPLVWDSSQCINGHLQISGMSGSGKSHQLKKLIQSAARSGIEVDVFDIHGDLHTPGVSSEVIVSEATKYGHNLLSINPDPHSGGVRKKINWVIELINSTSRKLGTKQEAALRHLLRDVFWLNGCYEDDPSSWRKKEITDDIRREIMKSKDYAAKKAYYPTIDDLLSYCERKIIALYTGGDTAAVTALERVNKLAQSIHRYTSGKKALDEDKTAEKLEKAKVEALDAYQRYLEKMQTGRELQDVLKYGSKDVLQSVLERLEFLNSSGIFRPNPPPFGDAKVRVHNIKSLSEDEQKLYIFTRCEAILRSRKDVGIVSDVEHVIVVDEAHNFFSEEGDNILNLVSKEGRKFGVGLWCASQSPTHFSEDFLSSCGAILLLYIHPLFWDTVAKKMNIDRDGLKYLRPGEIGALKIQRKREFDARFIHVCLDEREIAMSMSAA